MPVLISSCDLPFGILTPGLIIPHIFLINGASSASPEEVAAKKAELKKEFQELGENRRERELENEQHS